MEAFLINKRGVLKPAWNINRNVGPGPARNDADVQLVQFGFFCMGLPTSKIPDPADRPVYAAVKPGAPFSGQSNDPLCVAIRQLQLRHGGPQDGHVSRITVAGGIYTDISGRGVFMLIPLLNNMFDAVGAASWPRLDKHGSCPPAVRSTILAACTFA